MSREMLEAAKSAVRRMDLEERVHLLLEGTEHLSQEQVDRILGSLMDQLTDGEKNEFAEWLYAGHLRALEFDEVAETNRDLILELLFHLRETQGAGLRPWQAYDRLPPHLQAYMSKTVMDCTRWEWYRTMATTWWVLHAPKWLPRMLRNPTRWLNWSRRQRRALERMKEMDRGVYEEDTND
jgi:hypothetical protein